MKNDISPRKVELAEDIRRALDASPDAASLFDKMPYSHQNEYVKHIEEAKKPETRAKRIEGMVSRLREKSLQRAK